MTQAPAPDRGARSRDAILETAGDLMARHGYAAVSRQLPSPSMLWPSDMMVAQALS
jgi:hypothetical protein